MVLLKNKISNIIGTSKQTSKCCICLEDKYNTLHCKRCNTGIICDICVINLIENSMYDICPICRKSDPWVIEGREVILPDLENNIVINGNIEEYKCYGNDYLKLFIYKVFIIFLFATLFFVVGVIYKVTNNGCIFDCSDDIILDILFLIFYGAAVSTILACIIILSIVIIALICKICCCKK